MTDDKIAVKGFLNKLKEIPFTDEYELDERAVYVKKSADYPDYTDSQVNKRYKVKVVGGEMAEDLFNRGLCLPSGTAMTEEDLDRVISVILGCKK